MNNSNPLHRLAELCGILSSYMDIWGNQHSVPDETIFKILGSLNVHLDSGSNLEDTCLALENKNWLRYLPPVLVVNENTSRIPIEIHLPDSLLSEPFSWMVIQENGQKSNNDFYPSDLKKMETREIEGTQFSKIKLVIPGLNHSGYHQFQLSTEIKSGPSHWEMPLIITPSFCYQPSFLKAGERIWGISLQLYSLLAEESWGIGDFSVLNRLIRDNKGIGFDMIGINPLHSLFPYYPEKCSPYSPSNRLFLNILYLDVEAIPDFQESKEAVDLFQAETFQKILQDSHYNDLIDYKNVTDIKLKSLELLFQNFSKQHLEKESERGKFFRQFQIEGGDSLFSYSVFEALQENFENEGLPYEEWTSWPQEFQDPDSPSVMEFALSNLDRVEFFQYIQWQAQIQFRSVSQSASQSGFRIGIYTDLALSAGRSGSEVWSNQNIFVKDVSIGAPPDEFNPKGQHWGIPPMDPPKLRETGYRHFIALLRENMRDAGAIRIDHVMGFMRLFWIPIGYGPKEGAYVQYPLDDLLGIVALESQRNQCLVIGEDLGTVPVDLRAKLKETDIFSYRILWFEKNNQREFRGLSEYPENALVSVSTHDLPTLKGFWNGRDLTLRSQYNLFPDDSILEEQNLQRSHDRKNLLIFLKSENLLPEGIPPDLPEEISLPPELARSVYTLLSRSPSKIVMAQLEDIFEIEDQVNLPGTVTEHPNWRKKFPILVGQITSDYRFQKIIKTLNQERKRSLGLV